MQPEKSRDWDEGGVSGRDASSLKRLETILGTWEINGNGYSGKLEISGDANALSARIYYDVAKRWETLADVHFDGSTGELSFRRPWSGNPQFQKYRGTMSGNSISGTFTDNNSPGKTFPWKANKINSSTKPANNKKNSSTPPATIHVLDPQRDLEILNVGPPRLVWKKLPQNSKYWVYRQGRGKPKAQTGDGECVLDGETSLEVRWKIANEEYETMANLMLVYTGPGVKNEFTFSGKTLSEFTEFANRVMRENRSIRKADSIQDFPNRFIIEEYQAMARKAYGLRDLTPLLGFSEPVAIQANPRKGTWLMVFRSFERTSTKRPDPEGDKRAKARARDMADELLEHIKLVGAGL